MTKKRDVKLYANAIEWDAEANGLPTRMEIPPNIWTRLSTDDYTEAISAYISNEVGHYNCGFDVECSMSIEEMYKAVEEIEDELVKEYREFGETNYAAELELEAEDLETAICLMEAEQQSALCKELDRFDE